MNIQPPKAMLSTGLIAFLVLIIQEILQHLRSQTFRGQGFSLGFI